LAECIIRLDGYQKWIKGGNWRGGVDLSPFYWYWYFLNK